MCGSPAQDSSVIIRTFMCQCWYQISTIKEPSYSNYQTYALILISLSFVSFFPFSIFSPSFFKKSKFKIVLSLNLTQPSPLKLKPQFWQFHWEPKPAPNSKSPHNPPEFRPNPKVISWGSHAEEDWSVILRAHHVLVLVKIAESSPSSHHKCETCALIFISALSFSFFYLLTFSPFFTPSSKPSKASNSINPPLWNSSPEHKNPNPKHSQVLNSSQILLQLFPNPCSLNATQSPDVWFDLRLQILHYPIRFFFFFFW